MMPTHSRSELAPGTDKPFLTQSRLESFCKCPEAYRRSFLEGHKIPPGIAAAKGTGVHAGASANMNQKLTTGVDLPTRQIVELAVAGFEEDIRDGVTLSEEEQSAGETIIVDEAKDAVAEMAECHAREQAPEYQPVLVELTVEIDLPSAAMNLRGTIDLADDQRRVTDFKTSKRKKSQSDADDSVQLTVYAAAYHAATGEPSSEQRFDVVVQTKTKTYRDVVATTRGPRDYQALAHRINAVHQSIEAGIFIPTTPGAWWCSPEWCGYWRTCRFVNSERRAKAE